MSVSLNIHHLSISEEMTQLPLSRLCFWSGLLWAVVVQSMSPSEMSIEVFSSRTSHSRDLKFTQFALEGDWGKCGISPTVFRQHES